MILIIKQKDRYLFGFSVSSLVDYCGYHIEDYMKDSYLPIFRLSTNNGICAFPKYSLKKDIMQYNDIFEDITFKKVMDGLPKYRRLIEKYFQNGYSRNKFAVAFKNKCFMVENYETVTPIEKSCVLTDDDIELETSILRVHMDKGETGLELIENTCVDYFKSYNGPYPYPIAIFDSLTGEKTIIDEK